RAVFLRGSVAVDEALRGDGSGDEAGDRARDGASTGDGDGDGTRRTPAKARADVADHRAGLLAAAAVLETHELTKRFGGVTAVDGVDLTVHQGEILGLIGPNGAGKTTIFDLVNGFVPLDGGRVVLHGRD